MLSEQTRKIFEIGLVPLIVLDDAKDAAPMGKALVDGDVPVAEVTFRTDECLKSIEAMRQHVPELIVGAGTVHTVQQAKDAISAGATFIVTPAYNPKIVDWCLSNKVDIIPGTASPADIEAANLLGIEACKFFPAEAYGGVQTLKALLGPFKNIKFLPTGGVNYDNMNEYLELPNVGAVGGSFITPSKMVKDKDWVGITATCKKTIQHMFDFSLAHVGLHVPNRKNAEDVTDGLCRLMLTDKVVGVDNFFVGTFAEIVDHEMLGEHGHICIETNSIERLYAYYKRKGISINSELTFKDDAGRLRVFFLDEVVGGFSVHYRRR